MSAAVVTIEVEPGKGLTVSHNMKHPVDAARVLAEALRVVLAPQEEQTRIVKPNPPGLVLAG